MPHLVGNGGLRPIRNLRLRSQAPGSSARMHHHRARRMCRKPLRRQLVPVDILARSSASPASRSFCIRSIIATSACASALSKSRSISIPGPSPSASAGSSASGPQKITLAPSRGSSIAFDRATRRVPDISCRSYTVTPSRSSSRPPPARCKSQPPDHGPQVQQSLRRMLMHSVPRVQHRQSTCHPSQHERRPPCSRMPQDDRTPPPARFSVKPSVLQGLALLNRRRLVCSPGSWSRPERLRLPTQS